MTYQLRQPIQMYNWSIIDELASKPQWNVTYAYKGYGYAVKRTDGSTVCNLPDGLRAEEKELANFLALAPEMYDALSDAYCLLHDILNAVPDLSEDKQTKNVLKTLTKLINKIECE